MKPEEIMIGDWLLCPDNMQRQVRYLQVRPSVIGIGGSSYDEDEIQPIPITPEILVKNGFETHIPKECYLLSTDYYDLYIARYTDGLWEVVYSDCEFNFEDWRMYVSYTHELQHALRLCGINKEIEI